MIHTTMTMNEFLPPAVSVKGVDKMKNGLIAILLGVMLSSGLSANAQSSPNTSSSSTDSATRVASVVVGTIGGTPIAFARRWWDLDDSVARQWMKQYYLHTDNKYVLIPARLLSLPVSLVDGFFESPFWSFRNALKHSGDEPFSKDTFSLGPSLEGDLY